jgi:hypothetical protein
MLAARGFVCVSLDLPSHGLERRAGAAEGLDGWRHCLDRDENFVSEFASRVSAVLDHVIEENQVDELYIAACGTSRGGFAALHWAASDPRVRCVAAFAPVTDLLVLDEFRGLEGHALTRSLALANVADRLGDRRLWICIGNHDRRVGTDQAIEFSRRVTRAAVAQGKPTLNELHVVEGAPSPLGHRVHATAHQQAAEWIATNLLPSL